MVVHWVTALFTFNFFASGIYHASWHAMSDIRHFHTPFVYRGPPVDSDIAGVTPAGRNPARIKTT